MANNLMDYLPDYYDGVYEMEAIMHAQGDVLDRAEGEQFRLLLNQLCERYFRFRRPSRNQACSKR